MYFLNFETMTVLFLNDGREEDLNDWEPCQDYEDMTVLVGRLAKRGTFTLEERDVFLDEIFEKIAFRDLVAAAVVYEDAADDRSEATDAAHAALLAAIENARERGLDEKVIRAALRESIDSSTVDLILE
jgi:hypothetical protein